jgi:CubicO group peptidase (beta-lactamase class C family)
LDETVAATRPITVRDLLTSSLGFGETWTPPDTCPIFKAAHELKIGVGPNVTTMPHPDEWMRRLGTLPLMYQPGSRWTYHTASDVLGVLIARVAGQALEVFLKDRLLEPLCMKDTGFSVPSSKLDRLATAYWSQIDWDGGTYGTDWCSPTSGLPQMFDEASGSQWSKQALFPSGAAGMVSTVFDYLTFGLMMLNKGRHGKTKILARPTVEMMTTDHLTLHQKRHSGFFPGYFNNRGWGFGLSVVTRRVEPLNIGAFGWNGGLGTSWFSDPSEGLVGILMTQHGWTSPQPPAITRDFWTLAYQAIDD